MAGIQSVPNELKHLIISYSVSNLIDTLFVAPLDPAGVEPIVRRQISAILTALPGMHATVYRIYRDQMFTYEAETRESVRLENQMWLNFWRKADRKKKRKVKRTMQRIVRRRHTAVQRYCHMWKLANWIVREVTLVAAGLES